MNNLWVKPNFGAKLPKKTIDGSPYVDTKFELYMFKHSKDEFNMYVDTD